jgi:hypothetical protein
MRCVSHGMITPRLKAYQLIWGEDADPLSVPIAVREEPMKLKSDFIVDRVTDEIIFIIDTAEQTGKMSVTNDAEAVCEFLVEKFGNKRIVYQDTIGDWDELEHDLGYFKKFKPYGHEARKAALLWKK